MRVWITSYARPDLLKRAVSSWLRFTDFPITVFDNFSNTETSAVAEQLEGDRVKVILSSTNMGHSAAMAEATKEKEEFILFADNDVEITAPINSSMFSFSGIEGVTVGRFIDPVLGAYTVSRFHSSFLLVRKSFLAPHLLSEYRLPFDFGTLRYDTAAMLYQTYRQQATELSEVVRKSFVHYLGQSSKDYFSSMPEDVRDFLDSAGTLTPDDTRERHDFLWKKYVTPWSLI